MRRLIFLFLTAAAANAYPEVTHVADTGFIVENQIIVKTDRQTAWDAFTGKVDRWWPKDHTWWGKDGTLTIDSVAGGCFCEKAGDRSAEHMHIVFVVPGELMRMTGGLGPLQGMGMYGAMEWRFETVAGGTQITMTYRVSGINPEGFEALAPLVDRVQGLQLGGLGDYLRQ